MRAPIVSSNEINGWRGKGRERKKLMGQWWVAEIGENKISSLPLPVEKEKPFEKSYVESFPKPEYLLYISSLFFHSPFFYPPKRKKPLKRL